MCDLLEEMGKPKIGFWDILRIGTVAAFLPMSCMAETTGDKLDKLAVNVCFGQRQPDMPYGIPIASVNTEPERTRRVNRARVWE